MNFAGTASARTALAPGSRPASFANLRLPDVKLGHESELAEI